VLKELEREARSEELQAVAAPPGAPHCLVHNEGDYVAVAVRGRTARTSSRRVPGQRPRVRTAGHRAHRAGPQGDADRPGRGRRGDRVPGAHRAEPGRITRWLRAPTLRRTAGRRHAVSRLVLPRARKAWALSFGRQSRRIAARSPRQPTPAAGSRHPASQWMESSPIGPQGVAPQPGLAA